MTFGDFASLVQFGAALHTGSALAQVITDLGLAPDKQRLKRIEGWVEKHKDEDIDIGDIKDRIESLYSSIDIFEKQFSSEYISVLLINITFACLLIIFLITITFSYSSSIDIFTASVLTFVSILPGPCGSIYFAWRCRSAAAPIRHRIKLLEGRFLRR
ncbi:MULTISPECIES: hypothetical protein [Roseomonadaceae]|uniref:Uncharacterized protein n=1 Tax=Falsiroseomonas oleicola TaxID=2801474 RepID=A0ABS6H8W3_9PROT|nr:hypothetical protein [Roseomonas oleicola]MBU8544889.1 hypothetical protein [Roseomonas oleicola]